MYLTCRVITSGSWNIYLDRIDCRFGNIKLFGEVKYDSLILCCTSMSMNFEMFTCFW